MEPHNNKQTTKGEDFSTFHPHTFFVPTSGLGTGTNNMSYKLLIGFALKKGFRRLKVYGDSLNVINWIKGTYRCLNIRLSRLVEDIKCL
jgi:hypothetical protein